MTANIVPNFFIALPPALRHPRNLPAKWRREFHFDGTSSVSQLSNFQSREKVIQHMALCQESFSTDLLSSSERAESSGSRVIKHSGFLFPGEGWTYRWLDLGIALSSY